MGSLEDRLRPHVERRDVPGLVAVVSRRGRVEVAALGTKSLDDTAPIGRDAIFRITSMTKPVTAAAVLLLVEDGAFGLDDSVEKFLPELANRRVLRRLDGPLDDTVPARRAITVRDLLTFRLGFGMMITGRGPTPLERAEAALETHAIGPPMPRTPHPPAEWMRRFATLPLMFHPGERWLYNTGAHLSAVLVARAAGRPLEDFLGERLFEPLGMVDTSFSVPAAKLGRFVVAYRSGPGGPIAADGVAGSQWRTPPVFPDGAAGLVSTADDFLAFGRMLARRGEHSGKRILSAASVEAMATDHLSVDERAGGEIFLGDRGWGFGLAVDGRTGRFGWDGGFGTVWASAFEDELVAVLLTQRMFDAPTPPGYATDFWAGVG